MTLTYAGVPLAPPTQAVQDWIDRNIPLDQIQLWVRPDRLGKNRGAWAREAVPEIPPIRLGTLYWPQGAGRWAMGYFLATDSQLALIRKATLPGSRPVKQPLVMDTGRGPVTTSLWLLQARPLSQLTTTVMGAPPNNLWLLILVDDRFNLWEQDTGTIQVNGGTTQWGSLFSTVGVSKTDPFSINYLPPDTSLTANYEAKAPFMDALALNTGQRMIRTLDGTLWSQSFLSALQTERANLSRPGIPWAGGRLPWWKDRPLDLTAVLPGSLRVTFPEWVLSNGIYSPNGSYYQITTLLASLQVQTLSGPITIPGNLNTKTIHDTAIAQFDPSVSTTTPTNLAQLQSLATQIAQDWYNFQTGGLDLKIDGIIPWSPTGLDGSILWTYREGDISTRVQRPLVNGDVEEMNHWTAVDNLFTGTIPLVQNIVCSGGNMTVTIGTGVYSNGNLVTWNGGSGATLTTGMDSSLQTLTTFDWMGF